MPKIEIAFWAPTLSTFPAQKPIQTLKRSFDSFSILRLSTKMLNEHLTCFYDCDGLQLTLTWNDGHDVRRYFLVQAQGFCFHCETCFMVSILSFVLLTREDSRLLGTLPPNNSPVFTHSTDELQTLITALFWVLQWNIALIFMVLSEMSHFKHNSSHLRP